MTPVDLGGSAPQARQVQIEAAGEGFHPLSHRAGGVGIGHLQGLQHGGFTGGAALLEQGRVEAHLEGLLVARQPDAGAAIGAAALDFHPIEFLLQLLGVLLQFLGLFEGFGELSKIGETEARHAKAIAACRLGEAKSPHLRLELQPVAVAHPTLYRIDERLDVGGGGIAEVDDEVGMQF